MDLAAHLFVGATLCATSVGITGRVFRDAKRLDSPEARIVLGAAVIDDVLGLVILAVVTGFVQSGSVSARDVAVIVLEAFAFLVGAVVVGRALAPHLARVLALRADGGEVGAYLLGNWPQPFGIAFALDRLSALMVLLVALLGAASLAHALAHWEGRGAHFHALFQFQLAGLDRRLPHGRPLQPLRVLRGPAHRVLRAAAACAAPAPDAARPSTTWPPTSPVCALPRGRGRPVRWPTPASRTSR